MKMIRMKHSPYNTRNRIGVVVMVVNQELIKIHYVYQEKTLQVEEHDVMDRLMSGIM